MTITDRARAEADRRYSAVRSAWERDLMRGAFSLGAQWASEQDPTAAEVEAAREAFAHETPCAWCDGIQRDEYIHAALAAARDARRAEG